MSPLTGSGRESTRGSKLAIVAAVLLLLLRSTSAPVSGFSFGSNTTDSYSTNSSLRCDPSSIFVGETTRCYAEVTAAGGTPLTGRIAFTSTDARGVFSNMKCDTNERGGDGAVSNSGGSSHGNAGSYLRCRVDYASSLARVQNIIARYGLDPNHASTVATALLTITLIPTEISLRCDPSRVDGGKATHCDGVVRAEGATPLGGTVAFTSSDSSGQFGQAKCGSHIGDRESNDEGQTAALSCWVDYTASSNSLTTITATYAGDSTHSSSSASIQLNIDDEGGDSNHLVGAAQAYIF